MAYVLSPNDVVLYTCFGRIFNQIIMNTFHYKYMPDDSLPEDNGAAAIRFGATRFKETVWTTGWKPAVCDTYILDRIQCQIIHPIRRVYTSIVVSEVGALAANPLPPANSACITRMGELPGRGRNASLQITGCDQLNAAGGVWTADGRLLLNGLAGMLTTKLDTSAAHLQALVPVNWSLAKAAETNRIQDGVLQTSVRTEKRRVVGRGI